MRQQKHQHQSPHPRIERAACRFIREPRGKLVREAEQGDPEQDRSEEDLEAHHDLHAVRCVGLVYVCGVCLLGF